MNEMSKTKLGNNGSNPGRTRGAHRCGWWNFSPVTEGCNLRVLSGSCMAGIARVSCHLTGLGSEIFLGEFTAAFCDL